MPYLALFPTVLSLSLVFIPSESLEVILLGFRRERYRKGPIFNLQCLSSHLILCLLHSSPINALRVAKHLSCFIILYQVSNSAWHRVEA